MLYVDATVRSSYPVIWGELADDQIHLRDAMAVIQQLA